MPYKRRYNKKYDFKKKKTYRKRFADKAINTRIEKKIQAIAKREDNKNLEWFIAPKLICNYNAAPWMNTSVPANWGELNGPPLPANQAAVGAQDNPFALCLTEIGGNLINQQVGEKGDTSNRYLVKRVEAHMTFRNQTNITRKIAVMLVYYPNIMPGITNSPFLFNLDNIYQLPFSTNSKYNGMFQRLKVGTEIGGTVALVGAKKYTVLKKKVFALRPTGPSNGGRIASANAAESTAYHTKDIHLYKDYKIGKNFTHNPILANIGTKGNPCIDGNIYLIICCDGVAGDNDSVICYGIAGVKYRLKEPFGQGANAFTSLLPAV